MDSHEVLSVASSVILLRATREREEQNREVSADKLSALTTYPQEFHVLDSVPTSSRKVNISESQGGISRFPQYPEIAFIRPESGATYDGFGYDDVNMTSSNTDSDKIMSGLSPDTPPPAPDDEVPPPRRWYYLCHCRRDLLAVKIFYFAFHGGIGVALPYCAIFMKQLGLSAFQIGIISGVRPVLGFVSGPLWGAIADRFRIRRILMMISLFSWLAFYFALYFVPTPARQGTCPESLVPHRGRLEGGSVTRLSPSVDNNFTYVNNDSGVYINLSTADRKLLLENLSWLYESAGVYHVFLICLFVICGGELFQAPTTALSDAATLQVLGRESLYQYGAQRAWGPVGWAISSLVVGAILSNSRVIETICGIDVVFSDYRIISYFFIVIMIFSLAAAAKIDFVSDANEGITPTRESTKVKAEHSVLAVFKFFLNLHYGSWILTTFFVGVCNGVIWGFLYWHLDNLGASQLLMGLDSLIMCIFEFGAFFIAEHVIKYVGHIGIMYIGLVGYIVRFVVYAALVNPWFVLPVDALQGVTFSFIWVSLTSYTASAVPTVSLATIQGVLHGVYFGLGNGLGHLFGGILIGQLGAVITFNGFAIVCGVWLLLFFICQKDQTHRLHCSPNPMEVPLNFEKN